MGKARVGKLVQTQSARRLGHNQKGHRSVSFYRLRSQIRIFNRRERNVVRRTVNMGLGYSLSSYDFSRRSKRTTSWFGLVRYMVRACSGIIGYAYHVQDARMIKMLQKTSRLVSQAGCCDKKTRQSQGQLSHQRLADYPPNSTASVS